MAAASPVIRELFEIAHEQGVRQVDLADRLRTSPALVSSWKAGRHSPSHLAVEEMAQVLGYRLKLEKVSWDQE